MRFFKYNKNLLFYLFLLFGITLTAAVLYFFNVFEYFSFENLKNGQDRLKGFYFQYPLLTAGIYFIVYVFVSSLSLPFTVFLTVAGGLLFGLVLGVLLSSFASVIGATFSFLTARFFLRDFLRTKFKTRFRKMSERFDREGGYYLFTLRLVPLVPFFFVNVLMGLTSIKTRVFFIVSQIAMLPGTIIYTYGGSRLAQVQSLRDIASFKVLSALALLGIFPLAAKKLVNKRFYFKGNRKTGNHSSVP